MQGAPKSKEYLLLILFLKHAWMVHACLAEIVDLFSKQDRSVAILPQHFPIYVIPEPYKTRALVMVKVV